MSHAACVGAKNSRHNQQILVIVELRSIHFSRVFLLYFAMKMHTRKNLTNVKWKCV